MKKTTFTTEQVMTTMAVLKTIIERLVDIKRCDDEQHTTAEVAAGLYGMTAAEFNNNLVECGLAKRDEKGGIYFNEAIDAKPLGRFDKKNNTFVWTNLGIEFAVMILSNAGIYPGDKFIRLFIGNDDPQKLIDNYVLKIK